MNHTITRCILKRAVFLYSIGVIQFPLHFAPPCFPERVWMMTLYHYYYYYYYVCCPHHHHDRVDKSPWLHPLPIRENKLSQRVITNRVEIVFDPWRLAVMLLMMMTMMMMTVTLNHWFVVVVDDFETTRVVVVYQKLRQCLRVIHQFPNPLIDQYESFYDAPLLVDQTSCTRWTCQTIWIQSRDPKSSRAAWVDPNMPLEHVMMMMLQHADDDDVLLFCHDAHAHRMRIAPQWVPVNTHM